MLCQRMDVASALDVGATPATGPPQRFMVPRTQHFLPPMQSTLPFSFSRDLLPDVPPVQSN